MYDICMFNHLLKCIVLRLNCLKLMRKIHYLSIYLYDCISIMRKICPRSTCHYSTIFRIYMQYLSIKIKLIFIFACISIFFSCVPIIHRTDVPTIYNYMDYRL